MGRVGRKKLARKEGKKGRERKGRRSPFYRAERKRLKGGGRRKDEEEEDVVRVNGVCRGRK